MLLRPLIHYLVLGDRNFRTDREILLPDPHLDDPGADHTPRETALGVAQAALEFAGLHPHVLWIAGHADTAGSKSSNLKLSSRRAENVRLFLAGDRDRWAAHCHENAEVADWQTILRWVALTRGWDCNPGTIDDDVGPATSAARTRFRATYNQLHGGSLALDAPHGTSDWSAYYALYEAALAEQLGCEKEHLAGRRAGIRWNEPATLACGEYWPIDAGGRDDFPSATNRRVELLFFPPETGVPVAGDPPGDLIYGRRRFRFQPIAVPRHRPGRKLWIRFPLSVAQVRQRTWKLALASCDGGYCAERSMSESISADEYADVCFDGLDPDASYTLDLHEGDQKVIVFENVAYIELAGLSREADPGHSEADDALDPTADEDERLDGQEVSVGGLAPELVDVA